MFSHVMAHTCMMIMHFTVAMYGHPRSGSYNSAICVIDLDVHTTEAYFQICRHLDIMFVKNNK